jgi:ATP-dependent Clp protease ATP-binding subunit ClpA
VAARILDRLGVDVGRVRQEVEQQAARGDSRLGVDMQLTPRAKRVIDLAYEEARQLNNNYVGTEHLLLGLMADSDGIAGRVMARMGVDLDRTRREVMALQREEPHGPRLDYLPARLRDLLDAGLPSAAAAAVETSVPLENVFLDAFEKALQLLKDRRSEAFTDPASAVPKPEPPPTSPKSVPEPLSGLESAPQHEPSIPPDRERAIFKAAIELARRRRSEDILRAMLQETLDALNKPDDESA